MAQTPVTVLTFDHGCPDCGQREAVLPEPLPPKRSSTFSPARDQYWMARTASSTGFSVKWIIDCGLTFLTDQTSGALLGPRNTCAAPSR